MKRAVGKLAFFLLLDLESSGVGRQISSCRHETNEIIRAVVGVKSPNTIMKRMNALLSYYRWHKINMEGTCYPIQEGQLWQYLRSGRETSDQASSPTYGPRGFGDSQNGLGCESVTGCPVDVCPPTTDVVLQMSQFGCLPCPINYA